MRGSNAMDNTGKNSANKKDSQETAGNQTKAQLEAKIRERVASEAKAFDIVNRLIEPCISTDYLLEACRYIDNSHYDDIVEERAISQLCGYPVCNNPFIQTTKKKYQISTKTNTVYDITQRKKFCSNWCYQASQYLLQQIPQTPVWTRRDEAAIQFCLLPNKDSGTFDGDEVIGSKLFPLKQEVLLLSQLDQAEEAKIARKAKKNVSLEESQQLSDHLLSLSTDKDLDFRMENLTLQENNEEVLESGRPSNSAMKGKLYNTKTKEQNKGQKQSYKCKHEMVEERQRNESGNNSSGLESAMGHLSVQDNFILKRRGNVVNENEKSTTSGKKTRVKKKPASESLVVISDSFPEEDTYINNIDNEYYSDLEYDSDSEYFSESLPDTSVAESSVQTIDSDLDRASCTPDTSDADQQLRESKSAYLMRLLEKRKNLIAMVDDLQENPNMNSEVSNSLGSALNCSGDQHINANERKLEQVSVSNENHEPNARIGVHEKSGQNTSESCHSTSQSQCTDQPVSSIQNQFLSESSHSKPPISSSQLSPAAKISQIISRWITSETLKYLGLDSSQSQDENMFMSDAFLKNPEMERKYRNLCQRLANQEKDFEDILGEDEWNETEREEGRKPLPNFEDLKKQTKEFQIKVTKFLSGPTAAPKKSPKGDGGDGEKITESQRPIVLPMIDSHNQLLIRRRIVLERLDRAISSLLPSLGLTVQHVSACLRELVFTFSLASNNIVFKPAEWTFVAVILLKMLAMKSDELTAALQREDSIKSLNIELSHFGHSSSSLEQFMEDILQHCKEHLQDLSVTD